MNPYKELLEFQIEMNKLKDSERFSTCPKEVRDNTASHTWNLALMCIWAIEELKVPNLDFKKVIQLALVHDIAEYDRGDIDSFDIRLGNRTQEEKDSEEKQAMRQIVKNYSFGIKIYELWKEYRQGKTRESKFVKALDKIEATTRIISKEYVCKAGELEVLHTGTYANKEVKNFPELRPLLKEVKKKIKRFVDNSKFEWKEEFDDY